LPSILCTYFLNISAVGLTNLHTRDYNTVLCIKYLIIDIHTVHVCSRFIFKSKAWAMMQPEVMDAPPDTRDHIQAKTTLYTHSRKLVCMIKIVFLLANIVHSMEARITVRTNMQPIIYVIKSNNSSIGFNYRNYRKSLPFRLHRHYDFK
jgi:hypothetical protein